MKILTVISGKGGTGKTTLTGSFGVLAENKVMADCDVDAADLHLLLHPEIKHEEVFQGGKIAEVDPKICIQCGKCLEVCRFEAVNFDEIENKYSIDAISCEGCNVCAYVCPVDAIKLSAKAGGKWFISDTKYGPMVHAQLGIAQGNSGRLVTIVRQNAERIAIEKNLDYVIIDGAAGTGCPVVASITDADLVMAVAEPTLSGMHALERIIALALHFGIEPVVCINKYNLNLINTNEIERYCRESGIEIVGKIPFDRTITKALVNSQTVVEYSDNGISNLIINIWRKTKSILDSIGENK